LTKVFIENKYDFDTTCKWYDIDSDYIVASGNLCVGTGINSTCLINDSSLGYNNYSISCINYDVTDTWNDVTNNLDF